MNSVQKLSNSFMKVKYFLYLLLTTLTFFSCKDNNPVSSNYLTASKISGTIKDWNLGNDKQVRLCGYDSWNTKYIYSTSLIDSNGYFTLENLDKPVESMLIIPVSPEWYYEFQILHNSLVCSDTTAKSAFGDFFIEAEGDSAYVRVGSIRRCNYEWTNFPPKAGDFRTDYVYVNKNVNVTGIVKLKDYNSFVSTYEYNLHYSKGWNKQVVLYKSFEIFEDSGYCKVLISNTEPWGGYWRYNPY